MEAGRSLLGVPIGIGQTGGGCGVIGNATKIGQIVFNRQVPHQQVAGSVSVFIFLISYRVIAREYSVTSQP